MPHQAAHPAYPLVAYRLDLGEQVVAGTLNGFDGASLFLPQLGVD
jgi:hypothetical protein